MSMYGLLEQLSFSGVVIVSVVSRSTYVILGCYRTKRERKSPAVAHTVGWYSYRQGVLRSLRLLDCRVVTVKD